VRYEGAERSRVAPGVIEAIHAADVVIVCPSNPVSSVGPILAVPGVLGALVETPAHVVAVSPIVGGAAVSGPAAKMMRAKGLEVSVVGVARAYEGVLDAIVVDTRDGAFTEDLRATGTSVVVTDIVMADREREVALARDVLKSVP
jgi:LPPG:FO 2-phospho-L-lactate transferase